MSGLLGKGFNPAIAELIGRRFVFLRVKNVGKSPAFQLYASDFDMDTATWDNDEVGIYFRLLMYQWVNKSIPSNIERLSKIARISPKKFKKRWEIISKKFQENGYGGLINLKMEKVRQEQDKYRISQSEAGKRGVEKKKELGIYPFSNPSSDPSSDPSSENQALQSSSSLKDITSKEVAFSIPNPEEINESSILKIDKHLDDICKELYDRKIFSKAHAFKNSMVKKGKNKRAILHALSRCLLKENFEKDPYAYCVQVMNIENGNFNERDFNKTQA